MFRGKWTWTELIIGGGLVALAITWAGSWLNNNLPVTVRTPVRDELKRPALPFANQSTRDRRVFAAFFKPLPAPADGGGWGAVEAPNEIRFTSADWNAEAKHYSKWVSTIVLKAGEDGLVIPVIADNAKAGRSLYGQLSLHCGDKSKPEVIPFPPLAVDVVRE
jgi:hypothetical protein